MLTTISACTLSDDQSRDRPTKPVDLVIERFRQFDEFVRHVRVMRPAREEPTDVDQHMDLFGDLIDAGQPAVLTLVHGAA